MQLYSAGCMFWKACLGLVCTRSYKSQWSLIESSENRKLMSQNMCHVNTVSLMFYSTEMVEIIYLLIDQRTVQLFSTYHYPGLQCDLIWVIISKAALKSFQEAVTCTMVVFAIFLASGKCACITVHFSPTLWKSKLHQEN